MPNFPLVDGLTPPREARAPCCAMLCILRSLHGDPAPKSVALAQPGSLRACRTSASCDLRAGDCIHVVLSPSSIHQQDSLGCFCPKYVGWGLPESRQHWHTCTTYRAPMSWETCQNQGECGLFSVWTICCRRKHFMVLIRTEFRLVVLKQTNVKCVKLKEYLF